MGRFPEKELKNGAPDRIGCDAPQADFIAYGPDEVPPDVVILAFPDYGQAGRF
jgi:hypothetical protein